MPLMLAGMAKMALAKFAPKGLALLKRGAGALGRPGVGRKAAGVVAAGAGFEAGARAVRGRGAPSGMIDPRTGRPFKKSRGKGLSARDIRGAQKVARLVQAFGFRPKVKPRKRRGR